MFALASADHAIGLLNHIFFRLFALCESKIITFMYEHLYYTQCQISKWNVVIHKEYKL